MTSTVRCRPWRPHPRLRLILGIGGMIGSVAAHTSSTARGGGNNESACPTIEESGINRLAYAQTVFSSLSIVVCLAVMAALCKGVV